MLLRGSVATEYYKASGGDIVATQDVLNHARADTTELYIKGPQTRRIQSETIARLQELMLGWIVGAKADTEDQAQRDCIALAGNATVPFSHDCLNPAIGTASGSAAGRVCGTSADAYAARDWSSRSMRSTWRAFSRRRRSWSAR